MGRIRQLDTITANGIAAGEVVERPSSVVKELVENAIDAGATSITVEIENGGISMIRVSDNGCGMDEEDAKLAFLVHATSKLEKLDDLFSLHTMGFRGEALSSISAASRVRLKTKQPGTKMGTEIVIEAGKILSTNFIGMQSGTMIEVRDLFFNLPARYKFLKKDNTETQYIITLCERFAILRPDISFRLLSKGKEVLHTPGNNDSESTLFSIFGKDIVDASIYSEEKHGDVQLRAFVGKPEIAKSNRNSQIVFVNDRLIRSKTINAAIDEAYKTMLMKGRYAFIILFLYIPSQLVDVNVHPQKAEVRFWSDSEVFRSVFHIIQNVLLSNSHVADFSGFMRKNESENSHVSKHFSENIHTEKNLLSDVETTNKANTIKKDDHSQLSFIQNESLSPSVTMTEDKTDYISDTAIINKTNILDKQPQESKISGEFDTNAQLKSDIKQKAEQIKEAQALGLDFTITDLLSGRIIGVVFLTYILIELDKNLILLDQHAAHEKILFEQFIQKKKETDTLSIPVQTLITPEMIQLSPADTHFLTENEAKIHDIGFDFAFLGEREIGLRGIPAVNLGDNPRIAFLTALELMKNELPETDEKLLLLLATTACKAAVKGHDHLHDEEIKKLIIDLSLLKNPYHCPHGRPILIRLSQKDLEKEFKRIL